MAAGPRETEQPEQMKKLGWVVVVLVLVAMAAGTVLYAQAAGGGATNAAPGRGAGAAAMERERMMAQLETLGLSSKESAAAEKSVDAKLKARQALQTEMGKLRQVSENPSATDQQLDEAIGAYTKAMERYRAEVQAQDSALSKELSPKSRAKALVAGLLDNGLGGRGMRMGGGGRPGGGGGGRGGGAPGGPPQ